MQRPARCKRQQLAGRAARRRRSAERLPGQAPFGQGFELGGAGEEQRGVGVDGIVLDIGPARTARRGEHGVEHRERTRAEVEDAQWSLCGRERRLRRTRRAGGVGLHGARRAAGGVGAA